MTDQQEWLDKLYWAWPSNSGRLMCSMGRGPSVGSGGSLGISRINLRGSLMPLGKTTALRAGAS